MNQLVLFVSPISSHGSEGNHARLYSMVEAVRKLGYDTFLCLVDIPALGSQLPKQDFIDYWGNNYVYFKAGWRFNKSSWTLPIKGLFIVGLQRVFGKVIAKSNPLFRRFFNFQFTDQWTPTEFDSWLKEFSSTRPIKAVICEYAFMAGALPAKISSYTRIVDTHDVFTDRNKKLDYKFNWINLSAKQERTLLNRADQVIAIQEEEAAFFKELLNVRAAVSAVDIITAAIDTEVLMPDTAVIGYLASRNPINIQAINWFIKEVWPPIVAAVPNILLRIAGSISNHINAHSKNIDVMGFADDLTAFYNSCSCIINPALAGTGLKIKTIEALMHGKPVVATSEGASGLKQWEGSGFYIADSPQQFSEACIKIVSDKNLALSLSNEAKQFVNKRQDDNLKLLKRIINNEKLPK